MHSSLWVLAVCRYEFNPITGKRQRIYNSAEKSPRDHGKHPQAVTAVKRAKLTHQTAAVVQSTPNPKASTGGDYVEHGNSEDENIDPTSEEQLPAPTRASDSQSGCACKASKCLKLCVCIHLS
jgi:hypothetical protein